MRQFPTIMLLTLLALGCADETGTDNATGGDASELVPPAPIERAQPHQGDEFAEEGGEWGAEWAEPVEEGGEWGEEWVEPVEEGGEWGEEEGGEVAEEGGEWGEEEGGEPAEEGGEWVEEEGGEVAEEGGETAEEGGEWGEEEGGEPAEEGGEWGEEEGGEPVEEGGEPAEEGGEWGEEGGEPAEEGGEPAEEGGEPAEEGGEPAEEGGEPEEEGGDAPCPPGETLACNGQTCVSAVVGDGVCNEPLNCDKWAYDGGDCCQPGFIEDCEGQCTPGDWVGDGVCDKDVGDNSPDAANFFCEAFNYDGGDCKVESCLDIVQQTPGASDGLYELTKPDGSPYEVYCDMTTDGGGWTLVMKLTNSPLFSYFSPYWETKLLFNQGSLSPNIVGQAGDAKFFSFNQVEGTTLRAQFIDPAHDIVYTDMNGKTALNLFQGGEKMVAGWEGDGCKGDLLANTSSFDGGIMRIGKARQFFGINGTNSGPWGHFGMVRFGYGGNDEAGAAWEPRIALGTDDPWAWDPMHKAGAMWRSHEDCFDDDCGCYGSGYTTSPNSVANLWVR